MPIKSAFIVPHPPLIIPAVGKGKEIEIKKTIKAYETVGKRIAKAAPDTIIMITPHNTVYADYFHISPGKSAYGNLADFNAETESFIVKYNYKLTEIIEKICNKRGIYAGTLGEKNKALDHATMVPLHFINKYYKNYSIVRISVSGLSYVCHYEFGMCIKEAMVEAGLDNVIVIASGDLSHKLTYDSPYSYSPEGPEFDKKIIEIMKAGNFGEMLNFNEEFCDIAGECGLRSFIIMAGILDKMGVKPELLSYQGPFGVGYAVCCYEVIDSCVLERDFLKQHKLEKLKEIEQIRNEEDEYVRLARKSLENFIKTKAMLKCSDNVIGDMSSDLLTKEAGVFVSLKKNGQLRGCIGTIAPTTDCIAKEIIQNAVSAGINDDRFDPVTEDELEEIVYSVDVLSASEQISDKTQLDVKKYGIIVQNKMKRGLLLPNLDGVNTIEEQIKIALSKAGISPNESYTIERFEVIRHK